MNRPSKPPRLHRRVGLAMTIALLLPAVGCKSQSAEEADAPDEGVKKEAELTERPPVFPEAPLGAGAKVYDFSALAHNGQQVRLSDFWSKPVVVYFCSQNNADVCTSLALAIRDAWTDLHAQVGMVFAVSPEPTVVHREFSSEHKLSHLFLTDADATLHRIFGIQPGAVVSYLIDRNGVVREVFAPPAPNHGVEILDALTKLGLRGPDYPI